MMDESTEDSLNESLCDANLEELKEQWTLKQLELSKQVSEVLYDQWSDHSIQYNFFVKVDESLTSASDGHLFGGLDISFIEGDTVNACACYVVIDKDFKVDKQILAREINWKICSQVVYQDVSMVKLTAPYIPSFLGFREADILSQMVIFEVVWVDGKL